MKILEDNCSFCCLHQALLGSGHYLEQGRGWMILGRGYGFLGSAGGGVMEYP